MDYGNYVQVHIQYFSTRINLPCKKNRFETFLDQFFIVNSISMFYLEWMFLLYITSIYLSELYPGGAPLPGHF